MSDVVMCFGTSVHEGNILPFAGHHSTPGGPRTENQLLILDCDQQ